MNEFFFLLNLGEEDFLKNPKHSSKIPAVYVATYIWCLGKKSNDGVTQNANAWACKRLSM